MTIPTTRNLTPGFLGETDGAMKIESFGVISPRMVRRLAHIVPAKPAEEMFPPGIYNCTIDSCTVSKDGATVKMAFKVDNPMSEYTDHIVNRMMFSGEKADYSWPNPSPLEIKRAGGFRKTYREWYELSERQNPYRETWIALAKILDPECWVHLGEVEAKEHPEFYRRRLNTLFCVQTYLEGPQYFSRYYGETSHLDGYVDIPSYANAGGMNQRLKAKYRCSELIICDDPSAPEDPTWDAKKIKQYLIGFAGMSMNMKIPSLKKKDLNMDVLSLIGNIFTVSVRFAGSMQSYDYLSTMDSHKEGDLVVVDSPSNGLVIVRVISAVAGRSSKATKFIVDTIDTKSYDALMDRLKKASSLKQQLDAEVERARKMIDYEALAAKNPAIGALLDQLKGISSGKSGDIADGSDSASQ